MFAGSVLDTINDFGDAVTVGVPPIELFEVFSSFEGTSVLEDDEDNDEDDREDESEVAAADGGVVVAGEDVDSKGEESIGLKWPPVAELESPGVSRCRSIA